MLHVVGLSCHHHRPRTSIMQPPNIFPSPLHGHINSSSTPQALKEAGLCKAANLGMQDGEKQLQLHSVGQAGAPDAYADAEGINRLSDFGKTIEEPVPGVRSVICIHLLEATGGFSMACSGWRFAGAALLVAAFTCAAPLNLHEAQLHLTSCALSHLG